MNDDALKGKVEVYNFCIVHEEINKKIKNHIEKQNELNTYSELVRIVSIDFVDSKIERNKKSEEYTQLLEQLRTSINDDDYELYLNTIKNEGKYIKHEINLVCEFLERPFTEEEKIEYLKGKDTKEQIEFIERLSPSMLVIRKEFVSDNINIFFMNRMFTIEDFDIKIKKFNEEIRAMYCSYIDITKIPKIYFNPPIMNDLCSGIEDLLNDNIENYKPYFKNKRFSLNGHRLTNNIIVISEDVKNIS